MVFHKSNMVTATYQLVQAFATTAFESFFKGQVLICLLVAVVASFTARCGKNPQLRHDELRKFDDKEWPIDDDGQAVFWREDRFDIIGDPAFRPEIQGYPPDGAVCCQRHILNA